ncbi:MAG TPA: addiction module toxin, HicA family [Candidatus Sericytochromatia bacterium]
MKQWDLVKKPEAMGCVFIRHVETTTGIRIRALKCLNLFPGIARSKEQLAKHIIKMLSDGNA